MKIDTFLLGLLAAIIAVCLMALIINAPPPEPKETIIQEAPGDKKPDNSDSDGPHLGVTYSGKPGLSMGGGMVLNLSNGRMEPGF